MNFVEFFRDGGWGMYPTALFGFCTVVMGALHLARPRGGNLRLVVAFGALTALAGVLGTATGLITTFRYLERVADARQVVVIQALGMAESLSNLCLACALLIVAGLPTVGGMLRAPTAASNG